MSEFAVPEAAGAAPEFGDAASARAWLEHVPLANVPVAQRALRVQLERFARTDANPTTRLAVLEALREAVAFVQIEQARRFANRALPMADAENAVFLDTIALWEQMRLGYQRCAEAAAGDPELRAQAALVCQRLLAYTGLKMYHYHRAHRLVPAREWRALHEAFRSAERLGVAETAVKDYLNRDVHDTSPRIAYVRALLMGIANPNEMSPRQLSFTARLLERWAHKVEVRTEPPEGDEPPLVVDLAGEAAPERAAVSAAEPRYLDVAKLARSLRNRIGLLRRGESPAKLALGEDCVQPSCEQLLVFLYRRWCEPRTARAAHRRRTAGAAQCCNGLAAIHYYVGGRPFRQPGDRELTREERAQIATFGRLSTREEEEYGAAHGFTLEHWQLEDESAQGLKMVRPAGSAGRRYAPGQLVAVRPADAKSFLLGQVRWLAQSDAGDLYCGVRLLPGLPAAIAVRPTGLNEREAAFVQALSLGAVPALGAPASLVLPSGWFKPKRVLELWTEGPVRVRLTALLERGIDFERVAYEAP